MLTLIRNTSTYLVILVLPLWYAAFVVGSHLYCGANTASIPSYPLGKFKMKTTPPPPHPPRSKPKPIKNVFKFQNFVNFDWLVLA